MAKKQTTYEAILAELMQAHEEADEKVQSPICMPGSSKWDDLLMDMHELEQYVDKKVWVTDFNQTEAANYDHLEIIPLGDLHVGHKAFNIDKLCRTLDYILETPIAYTIFLGDQAEVATKESVGKSVYEEDNHLKEQVEMLYTLLKPLRDANKILGIHQGNHEFRMEALVGVNPMEWLARWLEVPYFGYQAWCLWKYGEQTYTCWSSHGKSAAQTFGGRVNAVQKQANVNNCDISLSGHIHEPTWSYKMVFEIDPVKEKVVPRFQYFVTCGGFLDYFGGYPEMKALPPTMCRPLRISLYKDKKFIKID